MSRLITLKTLVLALFLVGMAGYPVKAETKDDDLKQKIHQRSQKINEFRALLNDPDPAVRLSALDTMLKSDDVAMRELAYGIGFSSADQSMRAVCLNNRFASLKTVVIKIATVDGFTEKQQKALARWGGDYRFEIKEYDEKTGQFSSTGGGHVGRGQVTGTRIDFSQQFCNGSFRLIDGGMLEGELGCTSTWTGIYPGRIDLQ
jgi:hypothetical protein